MGHPAIAPPSSRNTAQTLCTNMRPLRGSRALSSQYMLIVFLTPHGRTPVPPRRGAPTVHGPLLAGPTSADAARNTGTAQPPRHRDASPIASLWNLHTRYSRRRDARPVIHTGRRRRLSESPPPLGRIAWCGWPVAPPPGGAAAARLAALGGTPRSARASAPSR